MLKNNYIIIFSILFTTNLLGQTTPQQMVANMQAGINIGNVLSAPAEGNWAPAVEEQYFLDVAAEGFSTVRIPMDFFGTRTSGDTSIWSSAAGTSGDYTGDIADYTVSTTYLNRIEVVVDWALNAGLITIIDLHGSTLKKEFQYTFDRKNRHFERTEPTSAKRLADLDKFTAIWTAIANKFESKSDQLLFEIINEPYFEITDVDMNSINTLIINTIRNTGGNNTTRNIIITGGTLNAHEAPTTIDPAIIASDSYLIATFHYYKPNEFTKSSRDDKDQEVWGSISDKSDLDAAFSIPYNWAVANNIPMLLGEFGADNTGGYNYSTGDLNTISANATGFADGGPENASRVEFHRYLAEKAIALGFAFTAWDAGPESNKTIHKRNDASSTVVYNIDNFLVTSYNPKVTTPSTVVDNSVWVEDVKDALLSAVLSVDESEQNDFDIQVYPNPAKNYITIKSKKEIKEVQLFTALGQAILMETSFEERVNISEFSNGYYLLKFIFKDGTITNEKLLIAH